MSALPLHPRSGHPGRRTVCLALVLLATALCLGVGGVDDGPIDLAKAVKVRAAVLLNFLRFTEWPASAFTKPDAPMVVGVLGDDPFGTVLEKTFEGKTIGNRTIRVVRLAGSGAGKATAQQLRECHLLFVADSEKSRLKEHLAATAGSATLTVGDPGGFALAGGMIELGLTDGKVTFSINRKAAEAAGLKLSAKLLQLGKIVEGNP